MFAPNDDAKSRPGSAEAMQYMKTYALAGVPRQVARGVFGDLSQCAILDGSGGRSASHPAFMIGVITLCLSLAMTGNTILVVVSALAGKSLAADKALATLPISLMFVGMMVMTIPASLLMKQVGRRAGFTVGAVIGVAAALVAAWGLMSGSFVVFALGGFLQGCYSAFWQYYRFAAAETVLDNCKSRAISIVMLGGVAAAVIGPELARGSVDLLPAAPFAGSFFVVAGLAALAVACIQLIDIPDVEVEEQQSESRPLREIACQPTFLIALLAAAIGYGSMALVMTATPLAMNGHAHGFDDSAFVIQWHALGMFLPSFFTGRLIRRFGTVRVVLSGVAAMFTAVAVNLSGTGITEFWAALILLGVGWNFMFVGGSTLLTESYSPAEKAKVQGLNDFVVFGTNAVASLSSGYLYHQYGWEAVNHAVLLPLLAVFAMALWLRHGHHARQRRLARRA
jgi:predicted MFS family arabinose efflux permease